MKRAIAAVVLVLVPVLTGAALTVQVGVQQGALVAQDTQFAPGVQLLGGLDAGLAFGIAEAWTVEVAAGILHVRESYPIGGVVYRGFTIRSGSVGVCAYSQAYNVGVAATATAAFAGYNGTPLLFFYPSVSIAPLFRLGLGNRLVIQWEAPLTWDFRADVAYSLSIRFRTQLFVEIGDRAALQSQTR